MQLGLHVKGIACLHLLFIRQGKILGTRQYFPKVPPSTDVNEVLRSFVLQFLFETHMRHDYPSEILLPQDFPDAKLLQATLKAQLTQSVVLKNKVTPAACEVFKSGDDECSTCCADAFATQTNYRRKISFTCASIEI